MYWDCLHLGLGGVKMWTVEPLVLSVEERDELKRRVRGLTTAHRDRQRAEVVLLAADGWPGTQIAPRVGMSQQSVCKWVYDAKKAA
jgi:DNA-directed RNA polymerase specialized sigma24 family protein